jgi:hypothetical protein
MVVFSVGKSSGKHGCGCGSLCDLARQKRIGLAIKLLSGGAQCARIMMIVWLLETMSNGTLVAVVADDAQKSSRILSDLTGSGWR